MSSVSFTVRRPSPVSRGSSTGAESDGGSAFKVPALPRHRAGGGAAPSPLSRSTNTSPKPRSRGWHERDSSDEDEDKLEDELVTGFDQFGVQRLKDKKPEGPLIIPALKNKDWREAARKRRGVTYVPDSARATTGADGSVGGLGTRDAINSGPQLAGLQVKAKRPRVEGDAAADNDDGPTVTEEKMEVELSEEQKAIQALISSANGEAIDGPVVDAIYSGANRNWQARVVSEAEALKQDVETLPEESTLQDYERVPVSQFGAAMLRGMGWKEGTAASRTKKGPVEPYLPPSRPALLGIGAKEREVLDDGNPKKKKRGKPDMKYMPLVKKERDGSEETTGRSRRSSRSPLPDRKRDSESTRRDRDRDGSDRKDRDDDRYRDDRRRDDYRQKERDDGRRDRPRGESRRRDQGRDDDRRRERRKDDRESGGLRKDRHH